MTENHVVAMGGGGFIMEPDNPSLDDYVLSLAPPRARVCFVPTASGDDNRLIASFYEAFTYKRCRPCHLRLFGRMPRDVHSFLLDQDVIYVGGGSTANMLAVWRLHHVDQTLRTAWHQGTVLSGVSAGGICWFEAGVTDSFGVLQPLNDGLGLLPGSACPHFDGEKDRRPVYRRLISEGFPEGYGIDDGAALHFIGTELAEVVASRPAACAHRVYLQGGDVHEETLRGRYLGL